MNQAPDSESFDDLLELSNPPTTPMTAAVTAELEHLLTANRMAVEVEVSRRRWPRTAVVGVASALVLGGVATTAAATGLLPPPWWEKTGLLSFTYTLPSGAVCEEFRGAVRGTDPASIDAVEEVLRETDPDVVLNPDAVQSMIEQIRTEENFVVKPDGTEEPAGYGTENYSADNEYNTAVSRILSEVVDEKLASEGLLGVDPNLSYGGQANCPGAQW